MPMYGGWSAPGSDYYCESGYPYPNVSSAMYTTFFGSDVLWDGHLCRHDEVTCCNPPNLPWFCKTFPTPITENLEADMFNFRRTFFWLSQIKSRIRSKQKSNCCTHPRYTSKTHENKQSLQLIIRVDYKYVTAKPL